ncbi:MAG TPA: helix-turn-helix transcriptional regulator [bacterium]|nr:helix-turn-helix transcriptional regulator [bacterium]
MSATSRDPQAVGNIVVTSMDQLSFFELPESMKLWCQRQHISQSALAMRVGISTSHLNQIIQGHARPSLALAQRIRAVIGRKSHWLARPAPVGRNVASHEARGMSQTRKRHGGE